MKHRIVKFANGMFSVQKKRGFLGEWNDCIACDKTTTESGEEIYKWNYRYTLAIARKILNLRLQEEHHEVASKKIVEVII